MNEKRRKKIRAYLISFVNDELNKRKRKNFNNLLINSTSLDNLAKKNMQSEVFLVKEQNFYYQQNIDTGWIMAVNCDINRQKPLMDFFTNKASNEINKIDSQSEEEEKFEIINQETIIKKNIDNIIFIHQKREKMSSIGTSLFQKREISDRKFNKDNNNGRSSSRVSNFLLRKSSRGIGMWKEKVDLNHKSSNSLIEDNVKLLKNFSNISLETELSRIIKLCHDEDYDSSQEQCISESRRSEYNKEIKIAKMYAKKLNSYCKKLKKIFDKKYLIDKNKKINNNIEKTRTEKKDKTIYKQKENKGKSHKIQKIKYKKIIPKKNGENNRENYSKFHKLSKNRKTNNNDSCRNNNQENSYNAKMNQTSRENSKKHGKCILKINQTKKRNSSTFKNKMMSKFKQVFFKSPKKIDVYKKNKSKQITSKESKKIITKKDPINDIQNHNIEHHIKKIIAKKKPKEHKIEKTSLFRTNRIKMFKRASVEMKMNNTGLEKITFLQNKTKSSFIPFEFNRIKKKSKKKKEKANYNNINNNSTSISQIKDTSDSSEIMNKEIDKNNKKGKKRISINVIKGKKNHLMGLENLKKINKRRSSNYDTIKIHKLKRISPLKTERKRVNNTTDKHKQKKGKDEINFVNGEISDFDDYNLIDDFLYKIKLKRGKNYNV